MGIGAFQARELVRAFGGELSVTSAPGRGTLVTIVLPKEDAVAAEVSHVTEDEPA
jgi:signal transduction histidine kinase